MSVLVIAPHPDDEVLGCGGTIAKNVENGEEVFVVVVTKGCEPLFHQDSVEKVREECKAADALLGVRKTIFLDFPAAMLEDVPRYKLNDALVDVIQGIKPSTVFIPHRGDMQLDHKMITDASMVALRPKYNHTVSKIYQYETLSETGWDVPNVTNAFIPTAYSDITGFLNLKLDAMKQFSTQIASYPNPRSVEAIKALAMYRGSNVGLSAAEAFELVREIV